MVEETMEYLLLYGWPKVRQLVNEVHVHRDRAQFAWPIEARAGRAEAPPYRRSVHGGSEL